MKYTYNTLLSSEHNLTGLFAMKIGKQASRQVTS